jgi:subtilase-type serine protease
VEPSFKQFAGLAWVQLETDGFTEVGGISALASPGQSQSVGYSTLGIRAATIVPLQNGMVMVPRTAVAWQHTFEDVTLRSLPQIGSST